MILSPRSGLWTPGHRRPPNVIELYDAAGEAGMAANLARGVSTAPTIVRAGNRYYRNGAAYAALADNKHAVEVDAAGRKFIGVYGERTNSCPRSTDRTAGWTAFGVTQDDGGSASPVATNWQRMVETTGAAAVHLILTGALGAPAQNQRALLQALIGAGDRYAWLRAWDPGGSDGVAINVDPATGAIVDTGIVGNYTLHASGSRAVGSAWDVWAVISCSNGTPASLAIQLGLADSEDLSDGIFDTYAGNAGTNPLGILWAGMRYVIGATGPGPIIETAGAAVTKNAEIITRPVGAYSLPGTWEWVIRTDDTVPTNKRIFAWYDASSDAVIELYLTVDGYVYQHANNGAGDTVGQSVAVAVNNGALHRVRASFSTNNCGLWVDGTVARDVSCAMPAVADLDVYAEGSGEGGNCLDGEIHEAKFTPGVWA